MLIRFPQTIWATEFDAMTEYLPQLTAQQAAAISQRALSVALSAGAGCGKTFVLTQRFLSHLQPGSEAADLSKLVAITFTDRAAREMRERIRQECQRRLEQCPANEVAEWLEIVRDLESARISTIHSFCAAVLRAHAVDAGIDPGFGLLEQTTSGSLLRHSVYDSLLAQLEADNEDAKELVLLQGLEAAREILQSLVSLRFRIDFSTWSEMTPAELAEQWQRVANRQVEENLRNLRRSSLARDVLQLLRDNETSNKRMSDRRQALLEALPEDASYVDAGTTLQSIRDNATVQHATNSKHWSDPDVYPEIRNSLIALRDMVKKFPDLVAGEEDDPLEAPRAGLLALRVAAAAVETYEQRKRESGVLDFDDLLLGARNLLRDSESVRRSAAAGIAMLMVDEFQDTDPVQAEIVRYLCGDELVSGKLFLVGDAKQSIYRFRRADPAVFAALRSEIPTEGQLPLSVNFRSQPAILNFVNALFSGAMGEGYEELKPHVEQLSPSPSIEFLWAAPSETDEADKIIPGTASGRRKQEADWIARRLFQLLQDDVPRIRDVKSETGLRPARAGDVVILLRAMSDVQYYEKALEAYDLPYYLVGGRAFFAQQEVYDLINLCQYLDDVDDEVSLAGVLRSPFFSLTDETLYALVQSSSSLVAGLNNPPPPFLDEQQCEQVRQASRVLEELRREKDRVPLHRLLNLALERTGYDAALLAEYLGKRKLANLRKLIEMARQFERTGLLTLSDFVAQLQDALADEADEEMAATHPETSNVIRLMTIHKSKGLEFPLVVVADMDRNSAGRPNRASFDSELGPLVTVPKKFGRETLHLGRNIHKSREVEQEQEETIRLLYVAMTRAADHLILSANLKEAGQVNSPWMNLLEEYLDLETGKPAIDETTGAPRIPEDYLAKLPDVVVHTSEPTLPGFKKEKSEHLLPLSQLRDEVKDVEPTALPPLLNPVAPDLSRRRQFSVSQLEKIDAELRAQPTPVRDRVEPTGDEVEPDFNAATILGTLVHAALEQVDLQTPVEPKLLVAACCASLPDEPSEEIRDRAVEMVGQFLDSDMAAELREAQREYRELEFLLKRGQSNIDGPPRFLAGLIDCVYETSAGDWVVADYKTGKLSHYGNEAAALAAYELQMGTYALAVKQLIGRVPDRTELIFVAEGCRRLTLEVNKEFLTEVEERLDAAMAVAAEC